MEGYFLTNRLDGKIVAETLAGYAEGQAFADRQRLTTLKSLSTEKSLAVFLALWKAWEAGKPHAAELDRLDKLKIEHLVERRLMMNSIIGRKKNQ